jgi:hypothetical protein
VKPSSVKSPAARLPVTRPLTVLYASSLAIAAIMAVASAAGLLYPARIYPTEELRHAFVANDVVDLCIGLPILLASMWLARRGKLIGLLFWPGALMYTLYNHIAYVWAMPQGWALLLHIALVISSAYTAIGLVASIDPQMVQQRLSGAVSEKLAGSVLVGLGGLFLLLVLGTVGGAIVNQAPIPRTELAVQIADTTIIPAWIIGGVLLWRRKPLGYVTGAGLLFQGSMLFVAVIAVVLLQPILSGAPFALGDVIVLSVMGTICFVPFGLFVRGVLKGRKWR